MVSRKLLIVAAALSVISGLFIISSPNVRKKGTDSIIEKFIHPPSPSPTPFPYRELTIPYLREREYTSTLGERVAAGGGQGYSSHITSYESDGLRINGLLTEPAGERPATGWPAIIFIHGYIPPSIYTTQGQYADYVDYLARNGFVVFKIDLRGHDQSEGEASGAYFSGDYIVDVLNARAALQSADFVDPDKIGLWGHSMAGNVVLRSLAARPAIPAAVIWAGAVYTYSDMQQYGIQDNSYRPPTTSSARLRRRQQIFNTHGEFSAQSPFWDQVAPTNYLDDLEGAIQLNHAADDDVVSVEYSRGLNALLDQSTVTHEYHEYPYGGHNISNGAFGEAMTNTVAFFRKYLDN